MTENNRFDYVKYDEVAVCAQDGFKSMCKELETHLIVMADTRARQLALNALEE